MKPIFTRLFILFLTLVIHQAATAQTKTVTTNPETWAALMASSGSTTCNGCTINIPAGYVLNLSSSGECDGCTFNGGTVNISHSFTFTNGGAATNFNNGSVVIGVPTTFYNIITSYDSMFVNSNLTIQNSLPELQYSTMDVAANVNVSTQGIEFLYSALGLSGTSSMTNGGSTMDFYYSTLYMSGSSSFGAAGGSINVNYSTLTLNDTASFNITNAFTVTSSTINLNDNSVFESSGSSITLQTNTTVTVGSGSLLSYANINSHGSLSVQSGSKVDLLNYNNTFRSTVTSYSGGTFSPNTYNCGGTYPNACKADYVYGCATISSSSVVACTTLAIAALNLAATPAGTNAINLTWSDPLYATAAHYLVQRSTDNGDWTTLATVAAGGYTAGDYQFEDPAALAGTDNYRIARVDENGATLYSAVSSVTIDGAAGVITLYPNPAPGHTFYIKAPNTEQLMVSIYTVTGQLLSRQSLQGQTQYHLLLPSQLLPGNAVIVQAISPTGKQAFPLLLQ